MSNIFEIIWKLVYWPVHHNQHDQKPSHFEVSGAKRRSIISVLSFTETPQVKVLRYVMNYILFLF